jgi:hypothetical protein
VAAPAIVRFASLMPGGLVMAMPKMVILSREEFERVGWKFIEAGYPVIISMPIPISGGVPPDAPAPPWATRAGS